MKSLNEWLSENGEDGILENQVSQIANRFVGLLHGVEKEKKDEMVEFLINSVKELVKD